MQLRRINQYIAEEKRTNNIKSNEESKQQSENSINKGQSEVSEQAIVYLQRPARKQVEKSLAEDYQYKEGDQEYNIWYDKYQGDQVMKDKEAALTRCDPETDSGYTRADKFDKHQAYVCLHFARGCCCEGANCKFYHRVPSLQECKGIDQSRDVFGRLRHAQLRDDMGGIGSFMKEIRSLYIVDFKVP